MSISINPERSLVLFELSDIPPALVNGFSRLQVSGVVPIDASGKSHFPQFPPSGSSVSRGVLSLGERKVSIAMVAAQAEANDHVSHGHLFVSILVDAQMTPDVEEDSRFHDLFRLEQADDTELHWDSQLWLTIPHDGNTPIISLPIKLRSDDRGGFTEVRGVRMVKLDADDPESELYWSAVDRGDQEYFVQAGVDVVSPLDSDWIRRCLLACWDVAGQAVKPDTPT